MPSSLGTSYKTLRTWLLKTWREDFRNKWKKVPVRKKENTSYKTWLWRQTQLRWSSTPPGIKERLAKQWSEAQASTIYSTPGGTNRRRLRLKTVPADLPRTEPSPEAAPAAVLTEAAPAAVLTEVDPAAVLTAAAPGVVLTEAAPATSAAGVADPAPSAADAGVMSNLTCTLQKLMESMWVELIGRGKAYIFLGECLLLASTFKANIEREVRRHGSDWEHTRVPAAVIRMTLQEHYTDDCEDHAKMMESSLAYFNQGLAPTNTVMMHILNGPVNWTD